MIILKKNKTAPAFICHAISTNNKQISHLQKLIRKWFRTRSDLRG